MFQNLPFPAALEFRVNSNGVTPCIVMNNDWVLYDEVSSFSPESWTKVVLQECAVEDSVYRLPYRYSAVQYYNQRQRFWQLEFVNERLRASLLPMLLHVTDLPLNKENAHEFCYPVLTYWNPVQGQLPRTLARPIHHQCHTPQ